MRLPSEGLNRRRWRWGDGACCWVLQRTTHHSLLASLADHTAEDAKAGKTGNSKARSQPGKELVPKAAGTQVLPGVTVKSRPTLGTSAAPAAADASGPAAQAKPAANKPGGSVGRGSSDGSGAAEASGKPGSGGGKRKAAAAPEDVARQDAKHASKSAPAAVAATGVDAKRQKAAAPPPAPAAQAAAPQPKQPEQRRASGEAAVWEEGNEAQLPGSGADELVEQYAANFEALQVLPQPPAAGGTGAAHPPGC